MKFIVTFYILLVTAPLAACGVDSVPKIRGYRVEKRAVASGILAFASGASWGLHERVVNHNAVFLARFPRANRTFWGAESWKNKYKGGVVANGRKLVPVQFTDAKHLLASGTQVLGFGAGVVWWKSGKYWLWLVLDLALVFGSYSLGNFITYNLIFR
jgi:hypothetical protein